MVKYRIPELSEFVQDFEFQYKKKFGGGSVGYLDFPSGNHVILKRFSTITKWLPMKVWWKPRTREEAMVSTTFEDGTTVTGFINPIMDCPFSIESMLKDKKIRVKI